MQNKNNNKKRGSRMRCTIKQKIPDTFFSYEILVNNDKWQPTVIMQIIRQAKRKKKKKI